MTKELEMSQIKCFHCKGLHTSIQQVKDCSVSKPGSGYQVQLLKQLADAKAALVPAPVVTAPEKKVPAHRLAKTWKAPVPAAEIAAPVVVAVETPVIKTGQDLELGMYQTVMENGAVIVYKVKFNKTGTFKLAEKLIISQKEVWDNEINGWKSVPKGKFYYAPGMMAKLTSENKMNEEQAKAFHDATKAKYGQDYGFCCVCGKLLTVKKSIDAGIGPVCQTKL